MTRCRAIEPVLVEGGDGHQIWQIDVVRELDAACDDAVDEIEPLHVDAGGSARLIHVDRVRHTTDQPVRMRVLAAEHGMNLDDVLLEIERLEVMRHRHEVRFGWQFIARWPQ